MKQRYTFTMDEQTHTAFKKYCKADDKKMSTLLERLVTNYLKYGENA